MTILNKKTITGAENVQVDVFGNNTVAFLADIPKNAVVIGVKVNGALQLSDVIEEGVTVAYPREIFCEGKRAAAVLRSVYDGNAIVDSAKAYSIESFEVEYIETAIAEA